jgi:hypothetical protein
MSDEERLRRYHDDLWWEALFVCCLRWSILVFVLMTIGFLMWGAVNH